MMTPLCNRPSRKTLVGDEQRGKRPVFNPCRNTGPGTGRHESRITWTSRRTPVGLQAAGARQAVFAVYAYPAPDPAIRAAGFSGDRAAICAIVIEDGQQWDRPPLYAYSSPLVSSATQPGRPGRAGRGQVGRGKGGVGQGNKDDTPHHDDDDDIIYYLFSLLIYYYLYL